MILFNTGKGHPYRKSVLHIKSKSLEFIENQSLICLANELHYKGVNLIESVRLIKFHGI